MSALLLASCVPVAPPPAEFSGSMMLHGHALPLPAGTWQFFAGVAINGQPFRAQLARFDGARLTGVLELTDIGPLGPPGQSPAGMPVEVCDMAAALAVSVHAFTPSAHDCVRVETTPGGELVAGNLPGNPLLRIVALHKAAVPVETVDVVVSLRGPGLGLIAQAWFDPADAGLANNLPATWTVPAVAADPAKVAYVRQALAWGEEWRRALIGALANVPQAPLAAGPGAPPRMP